MEALEKCLKECIDLAWVTLLQETAEMLEDAYGIDLSEEKHIAKGSHIISDAKIGNFGTASLMTQNSIELVDNHNKE